MVMEGVVSASATSGLNSGLTFKILSHVDPNVLGPRLGKLILPKRKEIDTPNFFAVGSRGIVPHLTPDVMSEHAEFGGVHVALEDFIERDTPPIMSCPGPSPIHTFTALPRELITLLAPRRIPAVSAPLGNSDSAISVYTSTGFRTLSNKNYISHVGTLKPDIAVGLADVSYGLKPGVKRVAKMADRTQQWVTQLLDEKREGQAIFAPVLSIDFLDQWEYINTISDELAEDLSGLAFYDSNLLPDIPAATWISKLPRLSLDEPTSPLQILRQISLGMDIFTVPFIGFATDAGIALTFRFPRPLSNIYPSPSGANSSNEITHSNGTSTLPLGIDMWPKTHATSVIPISTACNCYTCTTHHRAFIQHLLAAKEMLGWALIQIHNHHILSEFFAAIRKSIADGTFEADCDEFNRVYETELPEKSGQGPRVRGYHFKSEGPSEPKKNKAAWESLGPDDTNVEGGLKPDESATELEEERVCRKDGCELSE